jgi:hypothetical protein
VAIRPLFCSDEPSGRIQADFLDLLWLLFLECVFLLTVVAILFKHVDLRMSNPFGFGSRWRVFLLLAIAFGIFAFFFLGDAVIKMSRLARGDWYDLFAQCVALPGANILAGLVIYSEFGRPMSDVFRRMASGNEQIE